MSQRHLKLQKPMRASARRKMKKKSSSSFDLRVGFRVEGLGLLVADEVGIFFCKQFCNFARGRYHLVNENI